MRFLAAAAFLCGALIMSASGQAPAPQPPAGAAKDKGVPKAADKPAEKDKEKEKKKPEWPKEIGGRDVDAYIKDLTHSDAFIRHTALLTIPQFGPDVRKTASRPIVKALEKELANPAGDSSVALAALSAIEELGLEEADIKDASRHLGVLASSRQTFFRIRAIPALAMLGQKADNAVTVLTAADIVGDRSYEVRKAAISALAHVGLDENRGPAKRALDTLCGMSGPYGIKDPSVAVRVEAFHVLVEMGPPVEPRPKDAKGPPVIKKDQAAIYMKSIKDRLEVERNKGDKQVEVWARVAVMRFDPDKEISQKNLKELAALIVKGDTAVKLHALNGMGLIGSKAKGELQTIMDQLEGTDPLVRDAAIKAIAGMGDDGKPAIPALKALLSKEDDDYFKELLGRAIKIIEESKPSGGKDPPPADAAKPDPKDGPMPKGAVPPGTPKQPANPSKK